MVTLAPFLAVPSHFFDFIRNRREACCLIELGGAIRRFDTLKNIASNSRELALFSERSCSLMAPLIGQSFPTNASSGGKFDRLRRELIAISLQLDAFADSNQIIGAEFMEAGCPERVRTKLILASVERLVAYRIRCIAELTPRTVDAHWDLTIEQYICRLQGDETLGIERSMEFLRSQLLPRIACCGDEPILIEDILWRAAW